jgi:hypothetical protein
MANDYNPDKHSLDAVAIPGAHWDTQKADNVKKMPRATFRASVGHGMSLSGGPGQYNGTGGTGDPTIVYKPRPFMFSWAKYSYDMDAYLDEY